MTPIDRMSAILGTPGWPSVVGEALRMMRPMADRDPAFQWETEALRSGARRRDSRGQAVASERSLEPGWVTVRQAEGATGIPIGTLRRWAKQGSIPSRSEATPTGTRRLVWLDAVLDRAASLGRTDRAVVEEPGAPVRERLAPPPPPPPPPPPSQQPPEIPGQQTLVEPPAASAESADSPAAETLAGESAGLADAPGAEALAPSPEGPPDPPSGTMLVPVDAWNKMLMQLGNLHEAGRELAEARERAAKAETEATFLRERLRDLRGQQHDAGPTSDEPTTRRRWFGRSQSRSANSRN